MSFWSEINDQLSQDQKVALLYVIQSEGSSPGRHGFCMSVNVQGEMHGSIGGGIMEQKLVELAKSKLQSNLLKPFIMRQVHRKDPEVSQSGMICSGEQTIAFYFVGPSDINTVSRIARSLDGGRPGILELTNAGIGFTENAVIGATPQSIIQSESSWTFRQQVGYDREIYILGGGHVGLALSTIMRQVGFYVVIFDDRSGLNTMEQNEAAHRKVYIDYAEVADQIPEGPAIYVAIVSFGYRTDKEVLRKLVGRKYKYLGMMGSKEKVNQLFQELRAEGVSEEFLKSVRAPIGLPIHSKTPEEIAVSIAGEIIALTNKPE